jgi:hypothetical protein
MKKLLLTFAALAITLATSYGQGEVFFANRIAGSIDARARLVGAATGFADTAYNADIAVLRNGVWESVPGSVTPFRGTPGSAANGYITGFNLVIPGIAPGATATLRMRGFQGASYDASTLAQGQTPEFTVSLGGGTIPVPNMDGLGNGAAAIWDINVVPEPSTIALGVLGAAALLLRRRK